MLQAAIGDDYCGIDFTESVFGTSDDIIADWASVPSRRWSLSAFVVSTAYGAPVPARKSSMMLKECYTSCSSEPMLDLHKGIHLVVAGYDYDVNLSLTSCTSEIKCFLNGHLERYQEGITSGRANQVVRGFGAKIQGTVCCWYLSQAEYQSCPTICTQWGRLSVRNW